jgi:Arc/MetJ-type ribon-helix-helix transcriptional regulator
MRMITIYLPEPDLDALDFMVLRDEYPNRSEAIRLIVKEALSEYRKRNNLPNVIPKEQLDSLRNQKEVKLSKEPPKETAVATKT